MKPRPSAGINTIDINMIQYESKLKSQETDWPILFTQHLSSLNLYVYSK